MDHRLDPRPADSAKMDAQAAAMLVEEAEEVETASVSLRYPRATILPTQYHRQYLLQLHLRISPKMRALEIPP